MTTAARVSTPEEAVFAKVARRLIPLLFLGYVVAFLDRVNVGFAKLQMAEDLAFSDAVYGFGAGVFFIGYFFFEVPANLVLTRLGARLWLARIMITWGIISCGFMFTGAIAWGGLAQTMGLTDPELTFYVLRFLLGAAEAGFFPGVIYYLTFWFPAQRRAHMVALFMSAVAFSNVVGSPLSGAILQFMDGAGGYRGWQWLFMLEGLPSIVVGGMFLIWLTDTPERARWLTSEERALLAESVAREETQKAGAGRRHSMRDAAGDIRLWMLTLVYFCGVMCFYAVSFWMPTIVSELGIDPKDYFRVGLLSMIPWSVTIVAQVLWARRSDRLGERRWHSAAGLLAAFAGLMLLAFVNRQPVIALMALSLVTAGALCWVVVFWSLPTSFLSGMAAAAGIAAINSIGGLGGHFGPDLLGRMREAHGGDGQMAFLLLAGMALLGAIVTIVTPMRPAPEPDRFKPN